MNLTKAILRVLSKKERLYLFGALSIFIVSSIARIAVAVQENSDWVAISGGAYREGVVGQPTTINPVVSTNPADEDISALIYSRLFDLLFNYEVENEGRVYTIKLKENLKWNNGKSLTSDDVIFTIKTIQDPETRSPFLKNWQGVMTERVSELQIRFALPAPYTFFPNNLKRLPIIPKHIFENIPPTNFKLSAYGLEPVGSGPYRFEGYSKKRDGFITEYHLVANENYEGQKPFIKDFYFKFYENYDDMLKALRLREINGFGVLNPLEIENKADKLSKIVVNKIEMPRYYAIFFNPNINPILKNAELRHALTEAIDKQKIVREIFGDRGKAVAGPLNKELVEIETEDSDSFNPERAKSRIESLKNPAIELNLLVPKVDFLEETAKIIKDEWLAAGIKNVNLIVLEPNDMLESAVKTNNYEMLLFGNVLENPKDLFAFWHSSQRFFPGLNLSLYQNLKVDSLIENTRQTDDEEKLKEFLKEAETLIVKDAPAIFLFSLPYEYVHVKNLGGFEMSETGKFIINSSDRFNGVSNWSVARARIIK